MWTKRFYIVLFSVVSLFLFSYSGCEKEQFSEASSTSSHLLSGGATTSFVSDTTAYMQPLANLSKKELKRHKEGEALFRKIFTPDPDGSGLGPLFNQASCFSCHIGNGRGSIPQSEIDNFSGLLMRMSIFGVGEHGEPKGVPGYGTQLQTNAIAGCQAEGQMKYTFEHFYVTYPDGEKVLMHRPSRSVLNPYQPLPEGVMYSIRQAPPIFGLGLLEALSDKEILSRYEEKDENSDNITGRPNYVWDIYSGKNSLGKFGWKNSTPSVSQQSAEAFHQDMGITSSFFFPHKNGIGQSNYVSTEIHKPDIDSAEVELVSFYLKTLAPPAPRNQDDPIVQRGKKLFNDINCSGCHTPQMRTGDYSIAALSHQTIYPYSDLLLHEMGEELADSRPDFEASTNEWKTTPLWGIGLAKHINPNARFLHDGRAATLEESILWHGGESYWVTVAFKNLSREDRQAIIKFMESL